MNQDDEIKAQCGKVADALRELLKDDASFYARANDVSSALEDLTADLGTESINLRKLRRELKKRGYNR